MNAETPRRRDVKEEEVVDEAEESVMEVEWLGPLGVLLPPSSLQISSTAPSQLNLRVRNNRESEATAVNMLALFVVWVLTHTNFHLHSQSLPIKSPPFRTRPTVRDLA